MFPPSVPLILYAIIAQVPIDRMFLAGIIPGLLILGILSIYCCGWSVIKKTETTPFDLMVFQKTLWAAKWELFLPFIVLGGILSGVVTLDEAAALTALYACIVEICIHRSISLKVLPRIVKESTLLVGAILIILGIALGLTNYLITLDVPTAVLDWIQSTTESRIITLIGLNIFLLIVGCLMDIFSAIIIVVPFTASYR